MRTNVVLDDDLIEAASDLSSAKTRRGVIEEALRTFVNVRRAEETRRTFRERLRRVQSFTEGRRVESSAELLRRDRDRR